MTLYQYSLLSQTDFVFLLLDQIISDAIIGAMKIKKNIKAIIKSIKIRII